MTEAALGEACWPEVVADTLVVPLGSLEQHGHHLPLDTDTRIAVEVARRVAAVAGSRVLVAPPLAYGASGEHEGFTGTISIGSEALCHVLVELVRSASRTFRTVLLLSGHGGNADAVSAAVGRLCGESRDVLACFAAVPGGDSHAGRTETSLMLALAPHLVRPAPWRGGTACPLGELMPRLRRVGVAGVSKTGVLGDPTGATAAEGERLFEELVDRLAQQVLPRRNSA